MNRILIINLMILFCLISLKAQADDLLFPATYVKNPQNGNNQFFDDLIPFTVPDNKKVRELLLSLNDSGGLPFYKQSSDQPYSMHKDSFIRIKLAPNDISNEYRSDKVEYAVNFAYLIDFEENGSQYLMIFHTVMTGTCGITIWQKKTNKWSRVFITKDGPSYGGGGFIKKTPNGIDIIGFNPDYTCFSWNKKSKTFIAHAYVHHRHGEIVEPDDTVKIQPKLIETDKGWTSLNLFEAPQDKSKIIQKVLAKTKIWKIGIRSGFMLVLSPLNLQGEWLSLFKGKIWQLGWMKNIE